MVENIDVARRRRVFRILRKCSGNQKAVNSFCLCSVVGRASSVIFLEFLVRKFLLQTTRALVSGPRTTVALLKFSDAARNSTGKRERRRRKGRRGPVRTARASRHFNFQPTSFLLRLANHCAYYTRLTKMVLSFPRSIDSICDGNRNSCRDRGRGNDRLRL